MIQNGAQELVLCPTAPTALTYVRGAVLNPVSLSMMSFAVCVGIGYAGVSGALVAALVFLVIGTWATRYRWVRREIDRHHDLRARQKREADRLRKLRPAGPARQQQYCELRDLVGEIEQSDHAEASRFELQALLDHYIRLAIDHQRYLESLRFATTTELAFTDTKRSGRRREIHARRQRYRDECVRRIEQLADDLEAIDELVRLVAQRVAAPQLDQEVDHEIERRLWELDAVDTALDQLSA
jgi:hypothetical protein